MINVAVGWQLYERTGDPWSLGLVGVAELTPVLFLMVMAGNAADRYPRRNIGIFAHTVLTFAATGLALLSWLNGRRGRSTRCSSWSAPRARLHRRRSTRSCRKLLAPAEFANANAWLSSTFQLAAITGPAIGGMLIAATGAATLSFALAAVGQLDLHRDAADDAGARAAAVGGAAQRPSDRFAGFRFVARQPAVPVGDHARSVRGAVRRRGRAVADLRERHPAGRPGRLGWLRAAPGIGALRMALVTTRSSRGSVRADVLCGSSPASASRRSASACRDRFRCRCCLFFTGVFDNISVVIRLTLEQTITPDHLRGRVSAINYVFIGFSNEFGAFESGATAALFGRRCRSSAAELRR
jgi:hypothetical protein